MSNIITYNSFIQDQLNTNLAFARFVHRFNEATKQSSPDALLFDRKHLSVMETCLTILPEVKGLPRHQLKDVSPVFMPRFPNQKNYLYDDSRELDRAAYWLALEKYKAELNAYLKKSASGCYKRGIVVSKRNFPIVLFNEPLTSKVAASLNAAA